MKILKVLVAILLAPFGVIVAQDNLTGNWWGSRTQISNFGIDFEFVYTGEYCSILDCDLADHNDYLDNIDITVIFDLQKLFGWKSATLFAYFLGNNGGIPNNRVGAAGRYGTIQGISNIAAPNAWKIYEFWIEQNLLKNKLSLLFGLFDLNSEFDVQEVSSIFVNPSHGIGAEYAQSGENGPSIFPTTSLALRIRYTPTNNLYFLFGLFDGVPGTPNNYNRATINKEEGLLISSEIGFFEKERDLQAGFGKYSIGGWYYTANFEDLVEMDNKGNPLLRNDNFGVYISAEKFLFEESSDPSQGLALFVRLGIANGNINVLNYYWGTGISIKGLVASRDNDIFGIALGTAHASKKYAQINSEIGIPINVNEVILEITYSVQISGWLRIQPDYQYVINPMGTYLHQTANVAGIRFEIIL